MVNSPFFGHHEETLYNESLGDLRADTLKQPKQALVLHNKLHHLDETLERLPLAGGRWLRLQANLGNNQRLSSNGC